MSSVVQISEAASLALHSMVLIAQCGEEKLSVKSLAKSLEASENHLAKVMQRLSKAGLVSSVRGPSGGFSVSKAANEISFLDIYTAIEGELNLDQCPLSRPSCPMESCLFGGLIQKTTQEYKDYFGKTLLSDFF